MNCNRLNFIIPAMASAVLLSAGFLVPHCGSAALIALIPLLWMDAKASECGTKHFWWWYYGVFLAWNLITTFWVCNATFAGGIAASVINAAMMGAVWALFRLSKRSFKGALPYIFLAATWIAWEKAYFNAEVSWPWLTLGNAFAGTTTCIQWYEITGTLGGSLWIWACNLSVFGLLKAMEDGKWKQWNKKAQWCAAVGTILLFVGPLTASWVRYATYRPDTEGSLDAVVLQPDFDPYEKFESLSQSQQNDILVKMMREVERNRDSVTPLLLVAPETFTNDVVLSDIAGNASMFAFRKCLSSRPNTNLLFGASTYQIYPPDWTPTYTARQMHDGRWYEDHNSAIMIDGTPRVEIYHKSRLVVGVEKMPWPRFFSKVDKWLGGNVMGRCIGQEQASTLDFVCNAPEYATTLAEAKTPIGCAICYESVYPEYFATFVRAGARAMTVITNDAWWGDTPGYRQHLRYSALRAIETRRDIARCANTGISAFINSRGDIVSRTSWWERQTLEGKLSLSGTLTPFVEHGDQCGRICTLVFILLAVLLVVRRRTEIRKK